MHRRSCDTMRARGSWLALSCFVVVTWLTTAGARADSWTSFVSEENAAATCSNALATGLGCRGRYCDGVKLRCGASTNLGTSSWTRYVSEEAPNELKCPDGQFVSGIQCKGTYCDNVSLRCTKTPNLNDDKCFWLE